MEPSEFVASDDSFENNCASKKQNKREEKEGQGVGRRQTDNVTRVRSIDSTDETWSKLNMIWVATGDIKRQTTQDLKASNA